MADNQLNTVEKVKEFVNSFNNAVFQRVEYNELDGQEYLYFKGTKFAAEGVARELNRELTHRFDDRYQICLT